MGMSKGRPSTQTPELLAQLEESITRLGSLPAACVELDLRTKTVWRWRKADPALHARLLQAQVNFLINRSLHEAR